jgi:Fic family protein
MPIIQEIEPMIPSERAIDKSDLPDLVQELERKAATLEGLVSETTKAVITEHMRLINSYYSNLIEGNKTHPREVRKAMAGNYSQDPIKRDRQKESLAHIDTQAWLDLNPPDEERLVSPALLKAIHFQFYMDLPASLKTVSDSEGRKKVVVEPGLFREKGQEVTVGRHEPPEAERLEAFMELFSEAYTFDRNRGQKRIIAAMASHHRLMWIHPFVDGNGRVCRLFTDTYLKQAGVGAYGLWCLSRGLAKNNADYKGALAKADNPRQGDSDGRGGRSEKALVEFCQFMLKTAIDQVDYTSRMLGLRDMERRIHAYVEDRNKGLIPGVNKIRPEAVRLLEKSFAYGEFQRNEMTEISGLGYEVTKKLLQQMKKEGLLTESSSRSPLKWAIPEHAERYYFPELAPD